MSTDGRMIRSCRSQSQASCSSTPGASCSNARASRNASSCLRSPPASSPTEPCEHQCAMIASGTALPAAVRRQQLAGQVIEGETKGAEAAHRVRAAAQVVGYPAKPRQRAQLNRGTEPVLHPDVAAQPCSVVLVNVKNVTRSCSAISSGQLLNLASSVSDRNRTGTQASPRQPGLPRVSQTVVYVTRIDRRVANAQSAPT